MRNNRFAILGTMMVLFFGGLTVAACGGQAQQAQPDPTCFQQMSASDAAKLSQMVNQNGGTVTSTNSNDNGTADICVLESDGNGGLQAHYYTRQDNFEQYALYAYLTGQGRTLATYGLLSGDLDFGQALTLQLLTGMNSSGGLYHPYTQSGGGWNRQTTVINNVHVTYVDYGHQPRMSYATAYRQGPPRGYQRTVLAKSNGEQATMSKGSIASVKKVAAASSLTNPSKSAAPKSAAPAPSAKKPRKR